MSGVLLLRRAGRLWGVEDRAVRRVSAEADAGAGVRYAIATADGELVADEVLGVVETLAVRPAGDVFTRLWGRGARGLAVHDTAPLVVIDPADPPAELKPTAGDEDLREEP